MEAIFFKIVDMSLAASALILILVLSRPLLKRAPKWIGCLLWALVAVRLVCPVSIKSPFSLIPQTTVVQEMIQEKGNTKRPGEQAETSVQQPVQSETANVEFADRIRATTLKGALPYVWIGGSVILLLYAWLSWMRIRNQIRESVRVGTATYEAENIPTPFILGVFRPCIYLPFDLTEEQKECVLAHEHAHLKRWDHIWKPFGFLLLALYWFNPLCWLAYALFCRDVELACDELVIRGMNLQQKKAYSQALLSLSARGSWLAACPVAFGEVSVKQRIKSVLNYKKPQFWVLVVALLGSATLAVCFLTDPVESEEKVSEGDLPAGWGDQRDWLCGTIDQISEDEITISHKYFINEEDTARIEYFGLTGTMGQDIFLDGYEIVDAGETLTYRISKECEFIFVPWDHHMFTANWKNPEAKWLTHYATRDYADFAKYLSTYTSLDHQPFFYDIKDGEVVCIYETWLA